MSPDLRATALAFLAEEHRLAPDETEQALAVAREVLGRELARLRAGLTTDPEPDVRDAAHALKGTLLNLGLAGPAALARELENADGAARVRLVRALEHSLDPLLGPV